MWTITLFVVATLTANALAFPQNGGSFEVDGFVFDGPADRPFQPGPVVTPPPPQTTQGSLRTTPTTTTATATTASDTEMLACVNSCPVTPEYNPVCGTDRVMYNNPGSLNCAAVCGKAVTLNYYGPCSNEALRG